MYFVRILEADLPFQFGYLGPFHKKEQACKVVHCLCLIPEVIDRFDFYITSDQVVSWSFYDHEGCPSDLPLCGDCVDRW